MGWIHAAPEPGGVPLAEDSPISNPFHIEANRAAELAAAKREAWEGEEKARQEQRVLPVFVRVAGQKRLKALAVPVQFSHWTNEYEELLHGTAVIDGQTVKVSRQPEYDGWYLD